MSKKGELYKNLGPYFKSGGRKFCMLEWTKDIFGQEQENKKKFGEIGKGT